MENYSDIPEIIESLKYNEQGLIPAIAQQYDSNELLMMAWMNQESIKTTLAEGRAVYWSRSRHRLWRKGEQSGHVQKVKEIRLDCDSDVVLLMVEQVGQIACHTGRESCVFYRLEHEKWVSVDPIVRSPAEIYKE